MSRYRSCRVLSINKHIKRQLRIIRHHKPKGFGGFKGSHYLGDAVGQNFRNLCLLTHPCAICHTGSRAEYHLHPVFVKSTTGAVCGDKQVFLSSLYLHKAKTFAVGNEGANQNRAVPFHDFPLGSEHNSALAKEFINDLMKGIFVLFLYLEQDCHFFFLHRNILLLSHQRHYHIFTLF